MPKVYMLDVPTARLPPVESAKRPIRLGLAAGKGVDWAAALDSPEAEGAYQAAWRAFWLEDISTGEDFSHGDPRGEEP